jgi:NAD-dependent SIR2 family protein deacetylase
VSDPLQSLAHLVAGGGVVALSGAGLSTESGIPDYRGPTGLARGATPVTYQEFVGSAAVRQRYWARSHVGWRHIAGAKPNAGHRSVAMLESAGLVDGVITQNVDRLHQAADSRQVVDLHGRLDRVGCLDCQRTSPREELDLRLRRANDQWESHAIQLRPDGDAVITPDDIARFVVVDCHHCGGLLKPDVVFFGENVPKPRVAQCYEMVDAASALLVLGSSLSVMSGYRFVRHAARISVPIVIVNQGPTRGDADADLRIDAPLGATLQTLAGAVSELRATTLVPG